MHYKCKQSVRVFQYLMVFFGSVLLIVNIVTAIIKIVTSNTMVTVGTITTATTSCAIITICAVSTLLSRSATSCCAYNNWCLQQYAFLIDLIKNIILLAMLTLISFTIAAQSFISSIPRSFLCQVPSNCRWSQGFLCSSYRW